MNSLGNIKSREQDVLGLIVQAHPFDMGFEDFKDLFPVLGGTVCEEFAYDSAPIFGVDHLSEHVLAAVGTTQISQSHRESGNDNLHFEHFSPQFLLLRLFWETTQSVQVLPKCTMDNCMGDGTLVWVVEAARIQSDKRPPFEHRTYIVVRFPFNEERTLRFRSTSTPSRIPASPFFAFSFSSLLPAVRVNNVASLP